MPSLILINDGMERLVFPLGGAILLIGNDPQSGIYLSNNEISKNHASIVKINDQYIIRDNGSENGTYVNGNRITQQALVHNDNVQFGPYQFQVDVEEEVSSQILLNQQPTHLDRSGQQYRRSVTLQSVQGHPASDSVQIMMAGKAMPPAASTHALRKNSLILWGFGVVVLVGIIAIFGWCDAMRKTNQLVDEHDQEVALFKKALVSYQQRTQDLEVENARVSEGYQMATADLKKANAEIQELKQQAAHIPQKDHPPPDKITETWQVPVSDVPQLQDSSEVKLVSTIKELPEITMLQLEEIVQLLDLTEGIQDLKKMRRRGLISVAQARKFVRLESSKWKKVVAIAKDLPQKYTIHAEILDWLQHVILTAEMCTFDRLDAFETNLQAIDKEYLQLKVHFQSL